MLCFPPYLLSTTISFFFSDMLSFSLNFITRSPTNILGPHKRNYRQLLEDGIENWMPSACTSESKRWTLWSICNNVTFFCIAIMSIETPLCRRLWIGFFYVVYYLVFWFYWICALLMHQAAPWNSMFSFWLIKPFFLFKLFDDQHPSGVFVHASGVEKPLHECLDALEKSYGHMQGCRFRVWVDRTSFSQIGSDTWLVKFDKWESSGDISCFLLVI